MSFQPGANLYTQGFGNRAENVEVPHLDVRNPSSTDILYPIGKTWINTVLGTMFFLPSQSVSNGITVANWEAVESGSSSLLTLSDGTTKVFPDGTNNIAIDGTSNQITSTANPGAHSITLALANPLTFPGSVTFPTGTVTFDSGVEIDFNSGTAINFGSMPNFNSGANFAAGSFTFQNGTAISFDSTSVINFGDTPNFNNGAFINAGTLEVFSGASAQFDSGSSVTFNSQPTFGDGMDVTGGVVTFENGVGVNFNSGSGVNFGNIPNFNNGALINVGTVEFLSGTTAQFDAGSSIIINATPVFSAGLEVSGGTVTGDPASTWNLNTTNIQIGPTSLSANINLNSGIFTLNSNGFPVLISTDAVAGNNVTIGPNGSPTIVMNISSRMFINGASDGISIADDAASTTIIGLFSPGSKMKIGGGITCNIDNISSSTYTIPDCAYLLSIDTTSSSVTLSLPASPDGGQQYIIVDSAGHFGTNNCVVQTTDSSLILMRTQSPATSQTLSNDFGVYQIYYLGTKWIIGGGA